MARSKPPRKAYRPGYVDLMAHDTAAALATKLNGQQRHALGTPVTAALDGLRMGTGGWPAWCNLADGMNVAEQLAHRGICSDRLPEILAAQAALHELHTRQATRASWTLRAAELAALHTGVDFHLIQLQHCTQGEMRDAITAVQRRVAQALAGNAPKDARVCVGVLGKTSTAGDRTTAP